MLDFGFTIGAHKAILESISRITEVANKILSGQLDGGEVDDLLASELIILGMYRTAHRLDDGLDTDRAVQDLEQYTAAREYLQVRYQEQAFIQATYIYLYRSLLNVPPEAVRSYVRMTFSHVSAFSASSHGNFSTWPAFIAAAEAYLEPDMAAARKWLDWSTSFGIGSRDSLKMIIEEVWRRRHRISQSSGLSLGLVVVDWREVMQELDCEVLLI